MALWNEYVISIHALLAESDPAGKVRPWASHISIHALLAESDVFGCVRLWIWCISIHALLAESDEQSSSYNAYMAKFLSTLSLRRATLLTLTAR